MTISSSSDTSADTVLETLEPSPTSVGAESPVATQQTSSMWGTFFSTFITIFLAEMGDKTQLATLLLSAQSQSPWIVFIGAGTALIATSLVGVLLGRYLAKILSPRTLDIAAGALLMIVSILLLGDVVQL
ncbi:TMEM165/GDT1 family protein [Chamaesiphon minutus]|uniref:GDT1 family protein n=1 Tax=Chamaesiphon minutus (strain ATCC 27169 / PCC 6605) TaxID=1173020 RepID=K9UAK2_CHAP6|nr:TMEM165/GDT1 family protein [Chamaesiphon minutus]AFY91850.1 putative membrane protein [Chamaesiphon minutus PCC 6605]